MRYGKDQKEVRRSVQDSGGRGHRQRSRRDWATLPGAAALQDRCGTLGGSLSRRDAGSNGQSGAGTGALRRETPGQSRRADHDDRYFKKSRELETTAEKRRFVRDQWAELGSIQAACKAVGLPVSSYYYYPKKGEVEKAREEAEIRDQIEKIQAEFPFYGHRRIYAHLKRRLGITVNKKKLLGIMRKYGLKALIWRGFKVKTTDSNHRHGYAPNLLTGLQVDGPNQIWVADITYIRVFTGFVYLAAILDLFSRRVVGWAISRKIDHELCLAALKHAVETRRPTAGLIHHSDRGVQYACGEYVQYLHDHEIVPSMSAKGYCYDNAFMESWFKTLKAEEVYLTEYESYEEAERRLPEFIEAVYNNKRMHSGISYTTPVEYEELWKKGMLQKLGIQSVLNLPGKPSK